MPWCPICRGAEAVAAGRGEELRGQFSELQREALLTARAVMDHYLERLEHSGTEPVVEEIPIR